MRSSSVEVCAVSAPKWSGPCNQKEKEQRVLLGRWWMPLRIVGHVAIERFVSNEKIKKVIKTEEEEDWSALEAEREVRRSWWDD